MQALKGTNLWFAAARIQQLGKLHAFHYCSAARTLAEALMCLRSDHFLTFSRAYFRHLVRKDYSHQQNLRRDEERVWIYVPAQYDPRRPLP